MRYTHIRHDKDTLWTFCQLMASRETTISEFHFNERLSKPEIEGQLERLPEPICPHCARLATDGAPPVQHPPG